MRMSIVLFQQRGQLLSRCFHSNETTPQCRLSRLLPDIPTQVFTCHPNTDLIAVKIIHVLEVGAHNITDIFQR